MGTSLVLINQSVSVEKCFGPRKARKSQWNESILANGMNPYYFALSFAVSNVPFFSAYNLGKLRIKKYGITYTESCSTLTSSPTTLVEQHHLHYVDRTESYTVTNSYLEKFIYNH